MKRAATSCRAAGGRVSVLLRQPYDNLGYPGQEVVVSPGLSRNYLIPQGIAVYATEANRALYKVVLEGDALRKSESERAHRLLLARVANIVLIFQKATKEDGTLYSPVTASDIAAKLESTPLKNLGVQERNVRVGKKIDIPGEFEVHIEAVKASPGTFLPLKVRVGVAV